MVANRFSQCCSHILLIFTENKQSPTSAHERDDDDSGFENNTVTQFDEMLSDSETHNCWRQLAVYSICVDF